MRYIQIFFLTIFLLSNCSLNSTQKIVTESKNVSSDSESSLSIDEYSIIQPGLPGQESKRIDALMATDIAGASFVKADVDFLQGMIVHHRQAILMSKFAENRTNNISIKAKNIFYINN